MPLLANLLQALTWLTIRLQVSCRAANYGNSGSTTSSALNVAAISRE
jgi:hypothetical protein